MKRVVGRLIAVVVWGFLLIACTDSVNEVEVTGTIEAAVVPAPRGTDLEFCLLVERVVGRGQTDIERYCQRPEISGDAYEWRGDFGTKGRRAWDIRILYAELTYVAERSLEKCMVATGEIDRRIACIERSRRLTYVADDVVIESSLDEASGRILLDWDLGRAPDRDTTETQFVELAGRGVASGPCIPLIRTDGAWLAADGGRSIPLPGEKSLYLFGDTLLERSRSSDREGATFVGNTVGVGQCSGGEWIVDYAWRDAKGEPAPVFDLEDGTTRLWPVDGFVLEERLYVVLAKIIETDEGLGFDYAGSVLATVTGPLDEPARWHVEYQLLSGISDFRPNKGIVVHEGYAYLYSELVEGAYPEPAILLRVPKDRLGAAATHLQYLAQDGDWYSVSEFSRERARVVFDEAPPHTYVHRHPKGDGWISVQADPAFGSPDVVLRTARRLEGPWSKGEVVYKFPEMIDPDPALRDRDVICYAVAEHPQLRRNQRRELVVTYACNTLSGPLPAPDALDVYLPKSVLIDLGRLHGGALNPKPSVPSLPKGGFVLRHY